MTRALIFDVGGVLLRTLDGTRRWAWEDRLGLPRDSLEALVHGTTLNEQQERGELGFDEFWRAVGQRLGIPEGEVAQFRDDFYGGDALNAELLTQIARWRSQRRIRTGIISNAPPSLRVSLQHRHAIADLFDSITISGELGVRKPDPRIYQHALATLGVAASEAVFVDDLAENVAGARTVGLRAIQFSDNAPAIKQVEAMLTEHDHDSA